MTELSGQDSEGHRIGGENLPPMIVPQHGSTRFLRVRLEVQDGTLRWTRPRTLLGVIPFGTLSREIPLSEVRSLRLRRSAPRPLQLACGLGLIAAPPFVMPWWLALPVMAIGAWVALVSLGPALEVTTNLGRPHRAAVCFGHQLDAALFIEAVTGFIAVRRDGGPGHSAPA